MGTKFALILHITVSISKNAIRPVVMFLLNILYLRCYREVKE
jgi:hypothetical protein